ncbi:LysM peptidoglycan-binding domain-containing protein [Chungangia koreensis]|uniref:LysM peptidoglycan-binding domain-containing protein n=1 Tax=Chungangia koreensis TaxID=752657 RepID=A0ABV8X1T9_9LACT
MAIHVVSPGDTLWRIASRYEANLNEIVETNGLKNPNQLVVGEALYIPLPNVHIVQAGETLSKISNLYGTSIQAIAQANQIGDPNKIRTGMRLTIPRQRPEIEVNAYTYQPQDEAVQSVNEVGELLTYVSPFGYKVNEKGELEPTVEDTETIAAAVAHGALPMMAITNFSATEAGSNVAHIFLSNLQLREKIITNIIQIMKEKGYRGLNVDFENVLPEDRENYNAFLQSAVDRLHPLNYFVSTALAPKTSATQGGLLYEAHDYEAHGKIVDFVVLMTYEWGYRLGPPQAISPVDKMRQVVEYAVSVMPRNKIFLGFQIYARDWLIPHEQGQEAETFSPLEARNRAWQYGASIQYDETAQSPFYRYTDEQGRRHEVWFEDVRSAQAKFNLTKEFNLRGISYWALGYPYPQNWALLRDQFTIKKL